VLLNLETANTVWPYSVGICHILDLERLRKCDGFVTYLIIIIIIFYF